MMNISLEHSYLKMKQIIFAFIQDEFFTAEDAYNNAVHLLDTINNFVKPGSPAYDGSIDSSFHNATKSPSLHLPRIALPKFSGNSIDWKHFRHTFESLVDSNDAKFRYFECYRGSITCKFRMITFLRGRY